MLPHAAGIAVGLRRPLGAALCGGLWIPLVGMTGAMPAVGGILVAAGLAIATFRPGEA